MDVDSTSIAKLSNSWYLTKEELEKFSLSRKDGITESKESEIRLLYCSFIRDVGIRLKLPQMTIATAIMFCHRFYLHQSLVKNEWQTIATVCIFLASKVEDTPCPIDLVTRLAYEIMYKKDPTAARKIQQKDIFEKQKALILIGEKLVLKTIRFDFNIQHPYRPLLDAMKNLGITQKEVKQVAWNFVNDWLKTTLCLQYKPQYIAAGSLYLSAKLRNVKLPLHGAIVWWHQFDVAPKPLEEVIQHMMELVGLKKMTLAHPSTVKEKGFPSEAKLLISNSPDSVLKQSRSSSSPDIGDPSDHLQVDSNQVMLSRHTVHDENSQANVSLLNAGANMNSSSKMNKEESLGLTYITKRSDGVIACSHHTTSDTTASIDNSANCVDQGVSNCSNSKSRINGENLDQALISQHSDYEVNSCSGEPLDTDVDSKSAQHIEPPTTNGNHNSECIVMNNLCSDKNLSVTATSTMVNAPCVLPSLMEVDHLSVKLQMVDVAHIKDLLMNRKRPRETLAEIPSYDLNEEAWIEREIESGIVTKQETGRDVTVDDSSDDEAWIERELESGIVIGQTNDKMVSLDGLSEDDWIERELESGIIVQPGPACKKQKLG